jgi:hypothetical protein
MDGMPCLVLNVDDPVAALTVLQVHVFNRLADAWEDVEVPEVTNVAADHDGAGDEAIDLFERVFELDRCAAWWPGMWVSSW